MVVIYKMLPIGSSTAEIPQPPIAKNRRVSFFGWPILRGYVSFREGQEPSNITGYFFQKKWKGCFFGREWTPPPSGKDKKHHKNVQRDDSFRLGCWFNPFFRRRVLLMVFKWIPNPQNNERHGSQKVDIYWKEMKANLEMFFIFFRSCSLWTIFGDETSLLFSTRQKEKTFKDSIVGFFQGGGSLILPISVPSYPHFLDPPLSRKPMI